MRALRPLIFALLCAAVAAGACRPKPGALSPPEFSTTVPLSPSAETQPRIRGQAEAGTRIDLYSSAGCSGAPIASGSAETFEGPGIPIQLIPNQVLTLRARAVDASGATSECSTSRITYQASSTGAGYAEVYNQVDKTRLLELIKDMSGYNDVTVDGATFRISNRYTPAAKALFRKYWKQYFTDLGFEVHELTYPTAHNIGETQGHNLEAVLPGVSKDSVIVGAHYDSVAPLGLETTNPASDDNMTGMAVALETARILKGMQGRLAHTVRFVAFDYEEHGGPGLEGSRAYAKYLRELQESQGFQPYAGVNYDQLGWNCKNELLCGLDDTSDGNTFDVFSCSDDGYDFKALGDSYEAAAQAFGGMKVRRGCLGEDSDQYSLWEIGVPTVLVTEHNAVYNPYRHKLDTFDTIDGDYFFNVARVGATFVAQTAGLSF